MSLLTAPPIATLNGTPATSAQMPSPRQSADRSWPALLLLLAWCFFLFFHGLTTAEFYRTESLRAIIGAEFLRSGNWVVPTLYGQPLLTKPPGMYAAIALVSWPFGGVTEWTARLPSALAATVTVLLFYGYFCRQLGPVAGFVAAALLPASVMWLDKVPAAEIDMLQVAWVSAAILCFLRALEAEEETGWRWPWWLAALLCVAGGVLTKWTAPAFFYATVVPLLWWRGRLRLLFGRRHLVSAVVGAGVCFAWATAAVSQVGWDVFYDTVSREALQRLSPSQHQEVLRQLKPGHQPQLYPWGEVLVHPLKILATNLPWSAFALLALRPGFARRWDERGRRLLQALHCWTWPNLVFWSVIPEHALRHSFPLFPGFAGLAAMVWVAWLTGREPWPLQRFRWRFLAWMRLQRPRPVLVGLLLLWLVAKLAFVNVWIPQRNPNRAPREKGEQLAALVPEGETLYLFRLKDEGIMFYYSRLHAGTTGPPVRRFASPDDLLSSGEPVYCILDKSEFDQWHLRRPAEVLLHLLDEQGAPIVLVRIMG